MQIRCGGRGRRNPPRFRRGLDLARCSDRRGVCRWR
uniref:Uncharacterized protein n=1 Tax=Arundo donax TaxID=35708 RepID=A0A0A9CTJ2_ARUDO